MGWLFGSDECGTDEQGSPGVEGDSLAFDLGRGMAKADVAHRPHATWQDVAQISFHKLHAFDRLDARGIAIGAVFPVETDVGIGHRNDARITNGGAAHVSSEILDDVLTAAEWLKMHAPVLRPDGWIDGGKRKRLRLTRLMFFKSCESIAEATAKDFPQDGLGHEEVGILHFDHPACRSDAGTGHDAMNVGMKVQALVPGVEDHRETAGRSSEPTRVGEGFC